MQDRALPLDGCVVDLATGRVARSGSEQRLTTRECALLAYLAARPDVDVSRDELLAAVWGYAPGVATRAIDATALRLRTKIERDPTQPRHLITVWGTGYRFAPATAAPAVLPPVEGDLDAFIGREADEARLHALLAGPARLVTVVGPPGIGKSRLAHRLARTLPGLVWTAGLDGATEPAEVARRVALAAGIDEGPARLAGALAARGPALLVLDDAESALEGATALVSTWLRLVPALRIVVTSRVRLDVTGEHVVELAPLSPPDAVRLLVARAAGVTIDPDVAARIVARVDHLPLGIELAAGLLTLLSPLEALARLAAPLDALVGHKRDSQPRHASLRVALAGSWALLDPPHRAALAACAVFQGSFPVAAAVAVVGDGAEARLRGLRARSLVTSNDGRLRVLDTIRAFVAEVAPDPAAVTRHRAFYAAEVRARLDPKRAPDAALLAWIDREMDEIRGAFEQALRDAPEDAAWLVAGLYQPLGRRGPIEAAITLLDRAIAAGPGLVPIAAHLHRYRGHLHLLAHDGPQADADVTAAIGIAEAIGDDDLAARALALRGLVSLRRDRPEDAIRDLEAARVRLEEAGDTAYVASVCNNLGNALAQAERPDEARSAYQHALRLHRAVGNARSEALSLANLGLLDATQRRYAGARARLEVALIGHRDAGDAVNESLCLAHLGNVALVEGAIDDAIDWFEAAERVAVAAGFAEVSGRIAERRAIAIALAGDPDGAIRAFDALDLRLPLDDASLLLDRALVCAFAGRCREARGALERCPPVTTPGHLAQRALAEALIAGMSAAEAARRVADADASEASWMHELRPWFRQLEQHRRAVDDATGSLPQR